MSRDAERIEEEVAGAVRGPRPRSLASDYLRQAADALDAAGDPAHLYRKWRGAMPPRPFGFEMMRRWARAERFERARTSVLFCALAAEAYVNEFLAAFALSKTRLKELDRVSTVRKYTHGTNEAYGSTLVRDGDEATPVLRRLFALRHLLVHPKPGFGQPALLEPEDPALQPRFALPALAEYVVIVGGCADLMAWRAYGYGTHDVPGTMLWRARDAVHQFAAEHRALPEPDAEPRPSLWELVHARFDALPPLPDHPDASWTRIPRGADGAAARGPSVRQVFTELEHRWRFWRKRGSGGPTSSKYSVAMTRHAGKFGQLEPWRKGRTGKFAVDYDGELEAWTTDSSGSPHHADAVTLLGRPVAIEGDVRADGTLDVLASDPRAELDVIKARATQRAHALGMGPPSTWIRRELSDQRKWHFG